MKIKSKIFHKIHKIIFLTILNCILLNVISHFPRERTNKRRKEWVTIIAENDFSRRIVSFIEYIIISAWRWANIRHYCRHFFRQWTIDPERNRWVGREFVSPQIMEIEIYPSSTIVRRYVYLSRVGGLAYRGKETVLLRNTYETFFEGKPEIYYYQWNLEYLDLKRRIFR